jgi:prepilin-type N-terminal cleavage/methylation domain-containing protein
MINAAGTTRCIPSCTARARAAGGFTLIELILVILLLALFASITAPRLVGTQARRADMEAEAVRSFLSTAAHREATTAEPLAVVYNAETATLSAEVRRLRALPSGGGQELAWRQDALIAPVALSLIELRDAATDTLPLGRKSWRLEFPITEPRPSLRLVLGGRAALGDRTWTVALPYGAPAASLQQGSAPPSSATVPAAIDLDALGQGNQPW